MFSFMRDREPGPPNCPLQSPDQGNRRPQEVEADLGQRTPTLPLHAVEHLPRTRSRISRSLVKQPLCLGQPWERPTPVAFFPIKPFHDSGLGSPSSSSGRHFGSSPITNAQARLATRKISKDDLSRCRQSDKSVVQSSPPISSAERSSPTLPGSGCLKDYLWGVLGGKK